MFISKSIQRSLDRWMTREGEREGEVLYLGGGEDEWGGVGNTVWWGRSGWKCEKGGGLEWKVWGEGEVDGGNKWGVRHAVG